MSLSKRERIEKTLAGEPVDRVAVALWRHWPGDDQRPADFVRAVVDFQRQYDWDFIKFTPTSSFCIADYGVQDRWVGSLEGTREYTRRAVQRPEDWAALKVLDPQEGKLGRELEALRMLKAAIGDEVPILQTVFNPLAQAKNIAGPDLMIKHMRTHPEAFHAGLKTIAESTLRYMEALHTIGIDGIFYAVQHASYTLLTDDEYRLFGKAYDRQILGALTSNWWFNMLHLHGDAPMFDLFLDYPLEAINWHDRETEPTLAQGLAKFKGAACSGLGRWDPVHNGTPDEVRAQARDAIDQADGRRLILSTGCVMMITSPTSNLRAVREAVE
ncbi:MAG TPA: uroporphyrinogen decarboxylase family protein [Aggregatilineales bacterium]|nr:uroporphyrinogen decarboxylase family protein [Aggregatilineales bacterium]